MTDSFYMIHQYHNKNSELQVKGWLYGIMTRCLDNWNWLLHFSLFNFFECWCLCKASNDIIDIDRIVVSHLQLNMNW